MNENSSKRLIAREGNCEDSYIDNSNYEDSIRILRKSIEKDGKSGTEQDQIDYSISSGLDMRYQNLKSKFNKQNICKLSTNYLIQ